MKAESSFCAQCFEITPKTNEEIMLESHRKAEPIRMLLLGQGVCAKKSKQIGAGDTGKTTFLRQMKFLYGGGFSPAELDVYKKEIIPLTLDCMRKLLEVRKKRFRERISDPNLLVYARLKGAPP
jgi:hypothetical protein